MISDSTLSTLRSLLVQHEGIELTPYRCTSGKLTIGVGRNLDDTGISESEAMALLENDIKRVILETEKTIPWVIKLDPVRQIVLYSMVFNMGIKKFLGFRKMILALEEGEFLKASNEMLKSVWASQVKKRAVELATLMKTGQL
jgi:lysozyme